MQQRLEFLHRQLLPQASHPLLQLVVDEFIAIDVEQSISRYTGQMLANYRLWWNAYSHILSQSKPKFSGVFFEHSSIHDRDMSAEAYGYLVDENNTDQSGHQNNFHENFYAFGGVTVSPLNPLAKLFGDRPEPYRNTDPYRDMDWEHVDSIREAFYELNAGLLGIAIQNTFYQSDFSNLCQRPFLFDIRQHDNSSRSRAVAYLQ